MDLLKGTATSAKAAASTKAAASFEASATAEASAASSTEVTGIAKILTCLTSSKEIEAIDEVNHHV